MVRTRNTVQEKAGLLEDWQSSGINAAVFCRQRGVNYQNFLRWRAEGSRPASRKSGVPAFVELEVAAPISTPGAAVSPDATVVELSLGTQTVLTTAERRLSAAGLGLVSGVYTDYTYNWTGRLTMEDHIDTWETSLDRLKKVSSSASGSTVSSHEYLFDSLHRRTKATTEDATYWDYAYKNRSEATSGTKKLSGGTAITGWGFSYGYDNIGNRTSFYAGEEWGSYSSYNALNQPGSIGGGAAYTVKGRTESTGSPAVSVDTVAQTVTTQPAGTKRYFKASVTAPSTPDYQLVEITHGTQGSAYFKFVPAASYGPAYDFDGNLTEEDRWLYTWDANNRLRKMETRTGAVNAGAPNLTFDFKYDAFGRRIEKKKTWAAYSHVEYTDVYVYDGWRLIARVRNGALNQSYVWGLDLSGTLQGAGGVGGLLMIYTEQGTAKTAHFPAYDGNGNVMSLLNASSSAVEADCAYDPFGVLQRMRGNGNVEWDNPFRFSTKYTDDESGHLYYGYRYLEPRHGRWLGRDPIGEAGGLNLYEFVGNDGVNRWRRFDVVHIT